MPQTKVVDQAVPLHFKLLPELLKARGYHTHAVGKVRPPSLPASVASRCLRSRRRRRLVRRQWHLGYTTKAYTPTHRGYDTFYGYYSAMTEDYWAHTHAVADGCSLGR